VSDGEQFYDEVVAPALMDLAKQCQERGLSLVAVCQYDSDGSGTTRALTGSLQPHIRLTDYAAQARGNVDSLIIALVKDGEKYGHSSMFLNRLGVSSALPASKETTK
jgi:hypothetical protein